MHFNFTRFCDEYLGAKIARDKSQNASKEVYCVESTNVDRIIYDSDEFSFSPGPGSSATSLSSSASVK